MSKNNLSSVRYMNEFSIGGISDAISAAFGNPIVPSKPASSGNGTKVRQTNLKSNPIGKDMFLTAAEMNEVEEKIDTGSRTAMSYEEMIREVDDLTSGMKNRNDDLSELKKRLERCRLGIEAQEVQYHGLDKSAKDIHQQNKAMMKKFRSVTSFGNLKGKE